MAKCPKNTLNSTSKRLNSPEEFACFYNGDMTKPLGIYDGDSGGSSPPSYYRESSPGRVDIKCEESLSKWGEVLELSRRELLDAAEEFGPIVRDIRRGLRARQQGAA